MRPGLKLYVGNEDMLGNHGGGRAKVMGNGESP